MSTITSVLHEARVFLPSPEFSRDAHISSMDAYEALCRRAEDDLEGFWSDQAHTYLTWFKPFDRVLDWQPPFARWFEGGLINASFNCIDRHVLSWRRNKAAIVWEGEPGDRRVLTYQDLLREVSIFANVLKSVGVKKGDRVAIYLPLIPEIVIAMLACARIGAIHSVVFGGFSAEALRDRIQDAGCKVVVTADGGHRRGQTVPHKAAVDEAVQDLPGVEAVLVFRRTGEPISMHAGRDHDWADLAAGVALTCPPEPLESEHPLFILYTSGTTGKPKGVVHSTAGYLLGTAYSSRLVFDLKEEDVFWCTADAGWVTGHSYLTYGPLANGATIFMLSLIHI